MFPQISWLKIKISKKLRHGFLDKKAMIATTLTSSCHWKTLAPFCLHKTTWKTISNTKSELSQNCTEKHYAIHHNSKLTIDIWHYLIKDCCVSRNSCKGLLYP